MKQQETPKETPDVTPNPDAELTDEEINDISGGFDGGYSTMSN
jgi:hypothetical protein